MPSQAAQEALSNSIVEGSVLLAQHPEPTLSEEVEETRVAEEPVAEEPVAEEPVIGRGGTRAGKRALGQQVSAKDRLAAEEAPRAPAKRKKRVVAAGAAAGEAAGSE